MNELQQAEKELFEFYTQHLNQWLNNLKSYKSKTDVGRFPGKSTIEQSMLSLERLLSNDDSFDFFKTVVDNKGDYLDLEEDYGDIHEFFSNQLHTWQQLQQALRHFEKNKPALDKDAKAKAALAEMQSIETAQAPYNLLHKVAGLVSTVEAVNEAILTEKRTHALARVDDSIKQLESEIEKSGIATPELSNKLLRPLQLVKADLETETSISQIYMYQTQTAKERFDDGLYQLEQAVQQAIEKQRQEQEQLRKKQEAEKATGDYPAPTKPTPMPVKEPVAVVKPKPIVEVTSASVFNKVSCNVYLESQSDIDRFVEALKAELQAEVHAGKRVRIR